MVSQETVVGNIAKILQIFWEVGYILMNHFEIFLGSRVHLNE